MGVDHRGRRRSDVLIDLRPVVAIGVHAEAIERAAAGAVEAEAIGFLASGGGAGAPGGVDGRRVLAQQQKPQQGNAQQRHAQLAGLGRHRLCLCECENGYGRCGVLCGLFGWINVWLWWRYRWCSWKLL